MSTTFAASPTQDRSSAVADHLLASVASRDGARIGYRRFGSGSPLILLHGSASTGAFHTDIARLLADRFTVIVPDRRGRGLSADARTPAGEELEGELQDIEALIQATAARYLWGLSSGACLVLQAALRIPSVDRIALFEPPLVRDPTSAADVLRNFDAEMSRGNVGRAMVIAMRGAQMGPRWFRSLPMALTARVVEAGIAREAKQPPGPYPTMGELAPTIHSDFAIVAGSAGRLDDWRSVRADVVLMGGAKSPPFLKDALADLEGVLPRRRRVELAGVGHEASWNVDRRGTPAVVAAAIDEAFG